MSSWYNKSKLSEDFMEKDTDKGYKVAVKPNVTAKADIKCDKCDGTGLKDGLTLCESCKGNGKVKES